MKFFLILGCLVVSVTSAPTRLGALPSPALITEKESYIIGGQPAGPNQYPWMASLQWSDDQTYGHTCGAVYLGNNWIMSAAHCTQSAFRAVWLGIFRRSDTSEGQYFNFLRIINHPNYGIGQGAYPNDITLCELSGTPVLGPNIQPAELAEGPEDYAGQLVTITGWGMTCSTCDMSDELHLLDTYALHNTDGEQSCESFWGLNINDGMICIYDGSTGSCSGDSGGPMHFQDRIVIGVTSWGAAGCLTDWPSVYTRVSFFRDWIRETTGI